MRRGNGDPRRGAAPAAAVDRHPRPRDHRAGGGLVERAAGGSPGARRSGERGRRPDAHRGVRDERGPLRLRLRVRGAAGLVRDVARPVPDLRRELRDGADRVVEAYLRRTAMWYGGVGLLTGQVARSLALPPKYFRLIIHEVEVMGVQSAGVALTGEIFQDVVLHIPRS